MASPIASLLREALQNRNHKVLPSSGRFLAIDAIAFGLEKW